MVADGADFRSSSAHASHQIQASVMPRRGRAGGLATLLRDNPTKLSGWVLFMFLLGWLQLATAMLPDRITELRKETVEMFYHGYDNYMEVAFPEDELRPISCVPLTRDQKNPRHVELNDVLGNYSLTLIDSLSTLAILASAPPDRQDTGAKALEDFQDGVKALVSHYGDGTAGSAGQGTRARGFDVDSKVQVFETVIRGVGGLLSAHLFAAGELPINGYKPKLARVFRKVKLKKGHIPTIKWPNGMRYDGQLLRLALDLAQRLLPAFYTPTGMPYPRVNLRHGIPFYLNSPLNQNASQESVEGGDVEITETCSAGAGSLVLEFTVLSRLTDDPRFEQLAKRSFWAVWGRKSEIGLIGAGVDAESGHWIGPYAGIGAGTDSFFEYAFKSHILLSGHEQPNYTIPVKKPHKSWLDPNTQFPPLSEEENSPEAFLEAWQEGHAAIKRHLYSSLPHPHYINVHLMTGSPQAYWIDSLGAYYPGLLALAGEVEEAIKTNLLYTALWTRYAALPERWSAREGHVDGGLGWWPGRPEFIESNYHLYRATRDPWYLHVAEMVLRDITRRCWTKCGWSGLQDVRTGEKSDRMESFFLGETAKYLYLLLDTDHPLNSLDAAYVFTTEGHPLIIPKSKERPTRVRRSRVIRPVEPRDFLQDTCPAAPSSRPFTISVTASRQDLFHASAMTGLHNIQNIHASDSTATKQSVSMKSEPALKMVPNHTYYPWTLPTSLIPSNGTCDKISPDNLFTLEFPVNPQLATGGAQANIILGASNLIRRSDGILVKSLSGLKIGMKREAPSPLFISNGQMMETWRIATVSNMPLGRDERILISRDAIGDMIDPSFTRIRDLVMLDIVLQLENPVDTNHSIPITEDERAEEETFKIETHSLSLEDEDLASAGIASEYRTMLSSLLQQVTSVLRDPTATGPADSERQPIIETFPFVTFPAITPTGLGAAPIADVAEAPDPLLGQRSEPLLWTKLYFADQACSSKLPDEAARNHDIILIKRGGCTFSEKLANIPSHTPTSKSLKLVIVVSDDEEDIDAEGRPFRTKHLIRPLLDQKQATPSGLVRHHPISMVMVGGGEETWNLLKRTRSLGLRRRYHVEAQGLVIGNVIIV